MRILIADDHGVIRQGLRLLIEGQADMQVVAEAEDGLMAVRLAKELAPDVVIMDISMPNLNGLEASRLILHQSPASKIVILSMYFNRRFVTELLKVGVMGYVHKSYLFDELIRALRAAAAGERYLSPRIVDVLIEDYVSSAGRGNDSVLAALSEKERQMLQLLSEGYSIKQIALRLNISPKTADANRRQLMNKLGIFNVAELTKYAIREGLTSAEF
jgi:DNA-binding NarL/FixJ family response regulator